MAPQSPSSARESTPTSIISSLEETLMNLDEYRLPAELTPSVTDKSEKSAKVSTLIERYERLREEMLQRNIEHGVVEHVKEKDLTETPSITDSSDDDIVDLEIQRENLTKALHQTAERIIAQEHELHADFALLQQRKDELQHLLVEFQKKSEENDEEWSLPDVPSGDEEEEDEMMQRELDEQEEVLMELERKKLALQAKLESLREEADEVDKENMALDTNLAVLEDTKTLEKENGDLQKQLDQITIIKNDYDYRRLILEELAGIQIQSIEEEKVRAKGSRSLAATLIHVQLRLLHAHKLRVTIESKEGGKGVITNARFVENLPSPSKRKERAEYLYLPPLDDLLPISQSYPGVLKSHDSSGSGGFRFLVHSALARLETRNDRIFELNLLRERNKCEVEVLQNPSDPEDYLFQQVVCKFPWTEENTEVTAILRLTPDCPRVAGSLFLDDLKCQKHAWAIQHLAAKVQGQQNYYASPTKLISDLQENLGTALQQQQPKQLQITAMPPSKELPQPEPSPLNHDAAADLWEC